MRQSARRDSVCCWPAQSHHWRFGYTTPCRSDRASYYWAAGFGYKHTGFDHLDQLHRPKQRHLVRNRGGPNQWYHQTTKRPAHRVALLEYRNQLSIGLPLPSKFGGTERWWWSTS